MSSSSSGLRIENGKVAGMLLSPTAIRSFDSCPAGYIYRYIRGILPKIDTSDMKAMAAAGRALHSISEEDFGQEFVDKVLAMEKESVKKDVTSMVETAKKREYITEKSVTELYLRADITPDFGIRGYADRVSIDDSKIKIIDLKSTGNPEPYVDRSQVLSYAVMLRHIADTILEMGLDKDASVYADALSMDKRDIEKLMSIMGDRWDFKLTDVVLILDYTRVNKMFDFKVTENDVTNYWNYLMSSQRRIKKTVNSFLKHKDVTKVDHHPGSCGFCPMKGICVAYVITSSPHFNPMDPQHMTSENLMREFIQVSDIEKRGKIRKDVLKKALLMRYSEGDPVITGSCMQVSGTTTNYPTPEVVLTMLPKMMKKAVRNVQFKDMIDWEEINKAVVETILTLTPKYLKPDTIPEEYRKDVEDYKIVNSKAPYIKLKS